MTLPRPQRSTLFAGAVFAIAAFTYAMVGIDTTETTNNPAIPVYVVTTTTAPAPARPTSSSTSTEPTRSEPTSTKPAATDGKASTSARDVSE